VSLTLLRYRRAARDAGVDAHDDGQADAQTACNGGPTTIVATALEGGLTCKRKRTVAIRGPGLIQRFRGPGIFLNRSSGVKVTGVTVSTNCLSEFWSARIGQRREGQPFLRNEMARFPAAAYDCTVAPAGTGSVEMAIRPRGTALASVWRIPTPTTTSLRRTRCGEHERSLMTVGVERNVIRRNVIVGNSPVASIRGPPFNRWA